MKWCLSGRQSKEFIEKADELMVDWDNGKTIFDLIQINPTARIIVRPKFDQELFDDNYKWLKEQQTLCKENMAVACIDDKQANKCKEYGLNWFFAYPCRTFLQLYRAQEMGATDAYITDELCHNLDTIDNYFDITIRVIANSAGWGVVEDIKYLDGMCGPWFRPEDLWQLDQIDVCEFYTQFERHRDPIVQEQALYHIYAETHEWPGRVEDFVYNIERKGVINRVLDDNFQIYRSNCGMKCVKFGRCRHCETYGIIANDKMIEKIKKQIKEG